MRLTIGIALLATALVLLFIGRPNKAGDSPRFLQFEQALVLYPPLIMVIFAIGIMLTVSGLR